MRSLNNKIQPIMESIIDQGISILFVTETWLTSMKNDVTATIKSYGYNLIHYIRKDSVVVVVKPVFLVPIGDLKSTYKSNVSKNIIPQSIIIKPRASPKLET